MTFAVISIHDVAPFTWAECASLIADAERIGARTSLLVVPGPWKYPAVTEEPGFVRWLADLERRGHEIVAHGWEHRAVPDDDGQVGFTRRAVDRIVTRGCAEFGSLGTLEATRRAQRSLDALRGLGFEPTGFVAPGWSMSPAAADAIRAVGFDYSTTRLAIVDHHTGRSIPVPALCHRPGSSLAMFGARMLVAVTERRAAERRPVRLALHPADVHDARLVAATRRAVTTISRSNIETCTYAEALRECVGSSSSPPMVGGVRS